MNQVFIAAASQVGAYGGHEFLGSSILVDPRGRRLIGPLPGGSGEVALATIGLDEAKRAQDRRR